MYLSLNWAQGMYMIVAIPPTFCAIQKLCKQNFSEKGSFRWLTLSIRCLFSSPLSLCRSLIRSVGRPRERPIPYRPSVIYGCYGRLSLLLYYVFRCACPNVAGEREPHKKGMLKIKKAIPCHIVCYIHLVWSFHANLCAYVWVCVFLAVCTLTNRPIVYVLSSASCVFEVPFRVAITVVGSSS